MGALVTLELPPDSEVLDLPWIITFGPLTDEEDWEPVVCGPYEHAHALALAEEVVADEELMAVVEPVLGFVTPEQVRAEIATAKATAAEVGEDIDDAEFDDEVYEADLAHDHDHDHDETPHVLPGPDEIRAGMIRLAHRMASSG